MPDMMVLTSAKSRLMSPGTRIRSEMPWIACRSTSSATQNASGSGVRRSIVASRRSFGIVITVSTASRSSWSPRSACSMRRRPSNLKGLVTTAIVRAPSSVARLAMTGAAPVPVPPPRPVVTNTMSAPSSVSISLSVSSSAACRPTFGIRPGAEALGQLGADLDLHRRRVLVQRLQVGVGDDELDAVEACLHHAVHGVAAAPADTNDLDAGPRTARCVQFQAQRRKPGVRAEAQGGGGLVHGRTSRLRREAAVLVHVRRTPGTGCAAGRPRDSRRPRRPWHGRHRAGAVCGRTSRCRRRSRTRDC